MNWGIVSFGSNIEPEEHLKKVRQRFQQDGISFEESSWIWTEPIGVKEQPFFLNGVFLIRTGLSCEEMQNYLRKVEKDLGRKREEEIPYGPRRVDLDLILWNGQVIHPDYREREFLRHLVSEVLKKNKDR